MVNILIVDDQPHLQKLFCDELADEGYGVEGAADADGYLVKNFGALGKLKQKIADVIG